MEAAGDETVDGAEPEAVRPAPERAVRPDERVGQPDSLERPAVAPRARVRLPEPVDVGEQDLRAKDVLRGKERESVLEGAAGGLDGGLGGLFFATAARG